MQFKSIKIKNIDKFKRILLAIISTLVGLLTFIGLLLTGLFLSKEKPVNQYEIRKNFSKTRILNDDIYKHLSYEFKEYKENEVINKSFEINYDINNYYFSYKINDDIYEIKKENDIYLIDPYFDLEEANLGIFIENTFNEIINNLYYYARVDEMNGTKDYFANESVFIATTNEGDFIHTNYDGLIVEASIKDKYQIKFIDINN